MPSPTPNMRPRINEVCRGVLFACAIIFLQSGFHYVNNYIFAYQFLQCAQNAFCLNNPSLLYHIGEFGVFPIGRRESSLASASALARLLSLLPMGRRIT